MLLEALFLGVVLGGEALQRNAAALQIERWDKELKQMEIWDGIEFQIQQHCSFYGKKIITREKHFVYFSGDKSKGRNISMEDVCVNRDYWRSGLSPKEYAIKHYQKKFRENALWEDEYEVYRADFTSIKDLYLFDKSGNVISFSLGLCHDKKLGDDWKNYRVLRQYKGGSYDEVIFPISEARTANNCHE